MRYRATGTTVRVSADSIGGHSNDQHRPRHQWRRQPAAFFTLASTPGPGDTVTCSNDQVNFTDHPDPALPISPSTAASPP